MTLSRGSRAIAVVRLPVVLAVCVGWLCLSCQRHGDGASGGVDPGERCGVEVSGADARACELAFRCDGSCVATFARSVRGSSQQRGDQFAMAFIARDDMPLNGTVATLTLSERNRCSAKLVATTCYDRTGSALSGAAVSVRGAD